MEMKDESKMDGSGELVLQSIVILKKIESYI